MDKKNERLLELYQLAKHHKLVQSKAEFADFIGIDKTTLSHAFSDDGKVSSENAIMKSENALFRRGVPVEQVISGVADSTNIIGNNNQVGISTKKFMHEKKLLTIIEEKDKQIARLLTIIESLTKN